MYYHYLDGYQNYCVQRLLTQEFGGGNAAVKVEKYFDNYSICFRASKKYFGTIYPIRAILKDRSFKKRYNVEEIINFYQVRNRFYKNKDVCETCKKLKFYPNVYILALQCDLEDLINPCFSKSGNKLFYVFCKHHDILNFLDYDYFTEDSDSDSSEDDSGPYFNEINRIGIK